MTDKEIIDGLIARDRKITEEFFFHKCYPLFCSIINMMFDYEVDYDEFVNELYVYLMDNNAARLKQFDFRSTIFKWLKTVAIRYFLNKRDRMIEDRSKEPPYDENEDDTSQNPYSFSEEDLEKLLRLMPCKRYVYVIRRLMLDGCEVEELAAEMNIKKSNLYNIKKRAMEQLASVALNDINEYGK